jgi:hypothetical protein
VLKHGDARRASAVTDVLAGLGYPAPRYLVVGRGYSLQELLPGEPLPVWEPLAHDIIDRVLELNAFQAGRGHGEADWPGSIVRPVLDGLKPWVDIDGMRAHSRGAERVLTRCQEIVRRHSQHLPPLTDIVHFDFSPDNVLAVGGSITGVVDWDGVQVGDRLFDLATFLFYSLGATKLRNHIVATSGEATLAVYFACLCVRQTAWSIRFHAGEAGDGMVERCTSLLDELPPCV